MLEAKLFLFALAGALIVGVIAFAALRRGDVGQSRFFADQLAHGLWVCIKALLHSLEQMLMLPSDNPPLWPGRAL